MHCTPRHEGMDNDVIPRAGMYVWCVMGLACVVNSKE